MRVTVVMPAWNEAEGIEEFLSELHDALHEVPHTFVVVDDCSTDDTADRVRQLADSGFPVTLQRNASNSGHGPSTIAALRAGIESGSPLVLAIDGDGQFLGTDVARVVDVFNDQLTAVVEGVRSHRREPLYRRAVSTATRVLVWTRCHQLPSDANTPLRGYRSDILAVILRDIPSEAMTPNLLISAMVRRRAIPVVEVPVNSIPRRGSAPGGSTWGNARKSLPNRRFIRFCLNAAREWFRAPG